MSSDLDQASLPQQGAGAGKRRCDGKFQKTLAWCSYYTLVFVTLCTFQPATVASAAGMIGLANSDKAPIVEASAFPLPEMGSPLRGNPEWRLRTGN